MKNRNPVLKEQYTDTLYESWKTTTSTEKLRIAEVLINKHLEPNKLY